MCWAWKNLRNRLLPLTCLRMMFGQRQVEANDANRVVVLNLGPGDGEGGEDLRGGQVVDHVREVLRVSAAIQDKMPGVLRKGDCDEITAICRLEDGKRLVSVLSCAVLLDADALVEADALPEDASFWASVGASASAGAATRDMAPALSP